MTAPFQINAAGLTIIKSGEGCFLKAYLDPAGIPSIGFGHTPAKLGQAISQAQADNLLIGDISHAATGVHGATHDVPTTENQFSAMVSLAFNIGVGAFRVSSVLHFHRGKNTARAADAFLMWNKAHVDGSLVILRGLTKRREQERALYLEASA